jgi:Reverse transcriptase (RNA-dependent DNA polymerase)
MNCNDREKWKIAMREELNSLDELNTWELTELPEGRKAIGNKWVFKIKLDENGNVDRYKAPLVVKGYNQKYGQDYDEVFAPVGRPETLRILLSVAG